MIVVEGYYMWGSLILNIQNDQHLADIKMAEY